MEGFVAQVLQRRRNHSTFKFYKVANEKRPDLVAKFGIEVIPTLAVIEESRITARLEGPRGCGEIETFLAPWLQ
jgi:thioredoxin-like negative regulator of GroEL